MTQYMAREHSWLWVGYALAILIGRQLFLQSGEVSCLLLASVIVTDAFAPAFVFGAACVDWVKGRWTAFLVPGYVLVLDGDASCFVLGLAYDFVLAASETSSLVSTRTMLSSWMSYVAVVAE